MALSPLPETNTARYFYDYSVEGDDHTMVVRVSDDASLSVVAGWIDTYLTALGSIIATINTVGFRFAERGSNVTNPVDDGDLAGSYGTGTQSAILRPAQLSFTGRSQDGRKNKTSLFGLAALNDQSWRVTPLDNPAVTEAVAALNEASAAGVFVSISGRRTIWHSYMNIGVNDHGVSKARTGG